jgi:hypothetical protein
MHVILIIYFWTAVDDYQKCIPVICLIILNTNVFFFQITIDITAPQPGFVHDGIYGSPEIDYQNDMHLNVHWDFLVAKKNF